MNWDGQERREFPRAKFPCKIFVYYLNKTIFAQTENISRGGVRVFLDEELEDWSAVRLELMIKEDKSIKCEGQVRWVKKMTHPILKEIIRFSIGIMFTIISDQDSEYLQNLVEQLLGSQEIN